MHCYIKWDGTNFPAYTDFQSSLFCYVQFLFGYLVPSYEIGRLQYELLLKSSHPLARKIHRHIPEVWHPFGLYAVPADQELIPHDEGPEYTYRESILAVTAALQLLNDMNKSLRRPIAS